MRFTEHELTIAVTSAARLVSTGAKVRHRAEHWDSMTPMERYRALEAVGSQVLPVLIALPDVEVAAGTQPTFTSEQVRTAVEETVGDGRGLRHRAAVAARVALVQHALAALPVRQDPDGLLR